MNTSSLSSDPTPWQMVYQGADQILRKAQGLIASDKLADFMASVRWNEPFIRGVIAMQTALFLLSYLTRRNEVAQFGVLLVLTVVTLGAERINEYGSRNWSKFATQDYFDSSGLFMMVFVSGPFVVLANFIVIGMGMRLVRLYAKRLRRDARRRQRQQEVHVLSQAQTQNSVTEKKDN